MARASGPEATRPLTGARILVVEDDFLILTELEWIRIVSELIKAGYPRQALITHTGPKEAKSRPASGALVG